MSDTMGQQVLVENRPSAGGILASEAVAKAEPDGYTLLLGQSGPISINPAVYKSLPYDPVKDFAPISMTTAYPYILAVNAELPAKTLQELVALAKANPGKLNFAISGLGGAPQLAGIDFAQRTGVNWTYIPYKDGSDAVAAVAAGQADVLFNGMLATWPSVQGGRLKAIAISSAKRMPSAPDTPTVAEQGLPGFETGDRKSVG